jgi:hypothetical protein
MTAFQHPDHGLAQVLHQVETIRHLNGSRRSLHGACGIAAGPVPRDELNPRMPLQPGGQRFGFAVVKYIDGAVLFQVTK